MEFCPIRYTIAFLSTHRSINSVLAASINRSSSAAIRDNLFPTKGITNRSICHVLYKSIESLNGIMFKIVDLWCPNPKSGAIEVRLENSSLQVSYKREGWGPEIAYLSVSTQWKGDTWKEMRELVLTGIYTCPAEDKFSILVIMAAKIAKVSPHQSSFSGRAMSCLITSIIRGWSWISTKDAVGPYFLEC